MTREEAIVLMERSVNELREMMQTITMPQSAAEQLQQQIDAHEMAISALRQQEAVTDRHQMTNADRIRSMSDEELAEFLIDLADDGNLKIREWLQQPAEEDDHDT